ncbi:MAG: hypothetical protein GX657_17925, partial [Chloroflexi bacterium]|nr:hypothetical protein [Chloroflexota bacterium]
MNTALQRSVDRLLHRIPVDGMPAARELFSQLSYNYADAPLPLDRFAESERRWLHGAPLVLATAGDDGQPFRVIHAPLSDHAPQGRGFPLSMTAERAIAQRLLIDHPNALFLFSDVDGRHWHLANLRDVTLPELDAARIRRRSLRRIAVGPDERLRTAVERVTMLDVGPLRQRVTPGALRAADIRAAHEEAFDVSRVTEEFFRDYVQQFDALRQHVAAALGSADKAHDYAQQYLNRLMFLCFVQRKRWLGEDTQFLSTLWQTYREGRQPADTFGSEWLNVLFFEALNNKYTRDRSDRQYFPPTISEALVWAPFLNGGLFVQNGLDEEYAAAGGAVPDSLLSDMLRFLERYNFTIAEDTPLDQEVAVDPEMLGHVYESLVNKSDEVNERSQAGIFYTPRVEIDLMCRLALVRRLTNTLGEEHRDRLTEAVFALETDEKASADDHLGKHRLWRPIDEALGSLTVCDPACGSGAFLVGMLHVLDDLQARADAALGRDPRPYERKRRIIERSLYGVDVKGWAVRVAELRLWLYLVVESDAPLADLQYTPLLPSLEFKLRAGDSLVQRVAGVDLAHRQGGLIPPALRGRITRLKDDKKNYFHDAGSGSERVQARQRIQRDTRDLFGDILAGRQRELDAELRRLNAELAPRKDVLGERRAPANAADLEGRRAELQATRDEAAAALGAVRREGEVPFVWDLDFVEVLAGQGRGFDIVIGNPPYVRQEAIDDPLSP